MLLRWNFFDLLWRWLCRRQVVGSWQDLLLDVHFVQNNVLHLRWKLRIVLIQVLSEDDLILAKVFLRCITFELLYGQLVLKKLLSCRFQSLLFDRTRNVAFLKDASRDENIVIDLTVHYFPWSCSLFMMLICWKQESVEVVLILASTCVRR